MRLGEDVKTPADARSPYDHKDIFKKFDCAIDHVKSSNFTERDKRSVMERFLHNEEVAYFVYGLLFPQGVIQHA